eukprot:2041112-Rhodomonas_salina.1
MGRRKTVGLFRGQTLVLVVVLVVVRLPHLESRGYEEILARAVTMVITCTVDQWQLPLQTMQKLGYNCSGWYNCLEDLRAEGTYSEMLHGYA